MGEEFLEVKEIRTVYRRKHTPASMKREVDTVELAAEVFREQFGDDANEVMGVLYLNMDRDVIYYQELARGEVNQCGIRLMRIMQGAILCNAVQLILGHNHPAGECEPSDEDIKFTEKVESMCELHGFMLVDHIIMDRTGKYWSIKGMENTGYG